ncbi:MAG TPA: hypothetical protein VE616_22260, partial [Candidatus Udaeobacter sp.]|nr:hypothetical protein [Candidatus Udaeobacter sp.]
ERERKVLALQRAIRLGGSAIVLPPNTPRDRVEILQAAMRKALNDPGFLTSFRKLVGEDPTPLMPEELQKVIQEVPPRPRGARPIPKDRRRRTIAGPIGRGRSETALSQTFPVFEAIWVTTVHGLPQRLEFSFSEPRSRNRLSLWAYQAARYSVAILDP